MLMDRQQVIKYYNTNYKGLEQQLKTPALTKFQFFSSITESTNTFYVFLINEVSRLAFFNFKAANKVYESLDRNKDWPQIKTLFNISEKSKLSKTEYLWTAIALILARKNMTGIPPPDVESKISETELQQMIDAIKAQRILSTPKPAQKKLTLAEEVVVAQSESEEDSPPEMPRYRNPYAPAKKRLEKVQSPPEGRDKNELFNSWFNKNLRAQYFAESQINSGTELIEKIKTMKSLNFGKGGEYNQQIRESLIAFANSVKAPGEKREFGKWTSNSINHFFANVQLVNEKIPTTSDIYETHQQAGLARSASASREPSRPTSGVVTRSQSQVPSAEGSKKVSPEKEKQTTPTKAPTFDIEAVITSPKLQKTPVQPKIKKKVKSRTEVPSGKLPAEPAGPSGPSAPPKKLTAEDEQKFLDAQKAERLRELESTKKTAFNESQTKKDVYTTPVVSKKVKITSYLEGYNQLKNPTITHIINFMSLFADNEIDIWNDKPQAKFTWNQAIEYFERFFYDMRYLEPGTESMFNKLAVFNPKGLVILGQAMKLTQSQSTKPIYASLIKIMNTDPDEQFREQAQATLMKLYSYVIYNYWKTEKYELPKNENTKQLLEQVANKITRMQNSGELLQYLYETVNESKEKKLWREWKPYTSTNILEKKDIFIQQTGESYRKYHLTNERGNLLKMCIDIDDWRYPNVNNKNSFVAKYRNLKDPNVTYIEVTDLIKDFKRVTKDQTKLGTPSTTQDIYNFVKSLYTIDVLENPEKYEPAKKINSEEKSLFTGVSKTPGSYASATTSFMQKEMSRMLNIKLDITPEEEKLGEKIINSIYKEFEQGYNESYKIPERTEFLILPTPLKKKLAVDYQESSSRNIDIALTSQAGSRQEVDSEPEDEDEVLPSTKPSSKLPNINPISVAVSDSSSEDSSPRQSQDIAQKEVPDIKTSNGITDIIRKVFSESYGLLEELNAPIEAQFAFDKVEDLYIALTKKKLNENVVYSVVAMWNRFVDTELPYIFQILSLDENPSIFIISADRISLLQQNIDWIKILFDILVRTLNLSSDTSYMLQFRYFLDQYVDYIRKDFAHVFENPQLIENVINDLNEIESKSDIYKDQKQPALVEEYKYKLEVKRKTKEPKVVKSKYLFKIWLDENKTRFIGITA